MTEAAASAVDSPFAMLGGRAVVETIAARFYQVMECDEPALAALHRQGSGAGIDPEVKARFALFLVGWLGGPQEYVERHGHPRLRMRHGRVPVSAAMRDAWLRCMARALDDCQIQGPVRGFLDQRFVEVASFLMNTPG
jgi:hemoglobin